MNDQVLLITTNDIKYEFEIVHHRPPTQNELIAISDFLNNSNKTIIHIAINKAVA